MKLSTFVIVVALGVIFFSLVGGRLNFRLPAALKGIGDSFDSALTGRKVVRVDANESKPTVHVRNLSRVRGKVLAVRDDVAVVDCDVQGTMSKEATAKWNQATMDDSDNGRTNFNALAQAEADRQTFGELMMMDAQGSLRSSEFSPPEQTRGKVLLRGLPVAAGDAVHVVTILLGKDQSGAAVYTARFDLHKGSWMWGSSRRTLLDTQKVAPHAPQPLPSTQAK